MMPIEPGAATTLEAASAAGTWLALGEPAGATIGGAAMAGGTAVPAGGVSRLLAAVLHVLLACRSPLLVLVLLALMLLVVLTLLLAGGPGKLR